jgi:hypothetical protein
MAVGGAVEWVDPPPGASLAWDELQRPAFFQCAPADQRLARSIRNDERILLENLVPKHPRLVTSLPGVGLRTVVVDAARQQRPLDVRADTLWIDTDRGVVTVTYRATLAARIVEGLEVFVWLDGFEQEALREESDDDDASAPDPRATVAIPILDDAREKPPESLGTGTLVGGEVQLPAGLMPFTRAAAPPVAAPPLAPPPVAAPPPAPPLAPPAQAVPSAPAPPMPARVPAAPVLDTRKLYEEASARRAVDEPTASPEALRAEATKAAVAPAAKPPAVEVIWFDSTTEIDAAGRSALLADQVGGGEVDEFMSPTELAIGSEEVARREVGRWFRSAKPLALDKLPETLTRALEDESVGRPYVVVAGELAWSFDPGESLRAWIAIGTPLSIDPRVKEAIEAAERAMAENLVSIPDVLLASLDRLRDAVRANTKVLGATPIEAAAERWLVEERGFGKRRVWGQLRLRAHLHAKGARAPLPVYLPDGAGWEAPLQARFAARLVGELRSRQDPTEASPACLRAVALGIDLSSVPQ